MSNKKIDILKMKLNQLQKEAIDKLPDEETQSPIDSLSQPPPMDPAMMAPLPEPKPLVFNNKYLVKTDGPEFIVELTPSIVMDPTTDPSQMQPAQADPMADQTLNPSADPALLQQWLKSSDENDKPYSSTDQGTVDPLSQQEEGISDTGNEQSVKVHNKKSALLKLADDNQSGQNETSPTPQMPGADRSNAYPPCKYCANFNAADNTCSQGLDVEKVQAAKSCSWLNSNMKPFNGKTNPEGHRKDEDTVMNDVGKLPGGGENAGQGPNVAVANKKNGHKFIKEALSDIWD